jgi:feruloyl-CoA synthase
VAKILFTSGSTGQPKGVINTQRMLCANQEQIRTVMPLLGDGPPVLCDWLPWNHTFGGNHNVGIVLYNGGTLFIDQGRPVPDMMATTIANLRDVAPTAYFNVPRGFEMLVPVLEADPDFRRHFFSRLGLLFFAAAGLRSEVADRMQALAIETRGAPVPWVTGLGATETAPFALCTGALLSTTTHVGVPAPGLELKAVPVDGRLEARVAGPNVTPGYWRNESQTRDAFDEEGFYRTGDVIAPRDPSDLTQGFVFQGRLTEDFKLSTGTWVRVGWLRARLLAALGEFVQDVVITAPDRPFVGALIFPNVGACRTLAAAEVRRRIVAGLAQFNGLNATNSTTIGRALLLDEPPSIDAMEITDKGSLNQKAVLAHRAALVDALYAAAGPETLL